MTSGEQTCPVRLPIPIFNPFGDRNRPANFGRSIETFGLLLSSPIYGASAELPLPHSQNGSFAPAGAVSLLMLRKMRFRFQELL